MTKATSHDPQDQQRRHVRNGECGPTTKQVLLRTGLTQEALLFGSADTKIGQPLAEASGRHQPWQSPDDEVSVLETRRCSLMFDWLAWTFR